MRSGSPPPSGTSSTAAPVSPRVQLSGGTRRNPIGSTYKQPGQTPNSTSRARKATRSSTVGQTRIRPSGRRRPRRPRPFCPTSPQWDLAASKAAAHSSLEFRPSLAALIVWRHCLPFASRCPGVDRAGRRGHAEPVPPLKDSQKPKMRQAPRQSSRTVHHLQRRVTRRCGPSRQSRTTTAAAGQRSRGTPPVQPANRGRRGDPGRPRRFASGCVGRQSRAEPDRVDQRRSRADQEVDVTSPRLTARMGWRVATSVGNMTGHRHRRSGHMPACDPRTRGSQDRQADPSSTFRSGS